MTRTPKRTSIDALNPPDARALHPYLATITLASTYLLMLLGAYTSAIGAGLSCPDWPTCYGTWVPFLALEVVKASPYSAVQIGAEWAHRGMAVLVGALILGTAVTAWRGGRDRPLVAWSATIAVLLLPLQVFLGRVTVTAHLEPLVVTAHLGVAILIIGAVTTSALLGWLDPHARATGDASGDRR